MQDEVNEKTIALCIKGGKLTTQLFKTAMIAVLKNMEQQKHARTVQNKKSIYRGKQSLRKLMQEKCELSNIEITDGNIKSFEKYARKYQGAYLQTAKLVKGRSREHRAAHSCRLYLRHFVTQGTDGKTGIFTIAV